MKKLLIAAAGLFLLSLPMASFAGVSGTPHDMSAYAGGGTVTEELCFGCHIPHGAQGDKLWAMDTTGHTTGMLPFEALCYTCHDGSIATLYDVFDKADGLVDHTMVGSDCSGDGACHDVHNQPVADGKFLAEGFGAGGSGCENCHDATVFAGAPAADHTVAGNHVIGAGVGNAGLACEDCHGAHTGVTQGDGTNNSYILLANNHPTGGAYGAICVACHNNQAPFAGYVTDIFNYAQTTVDGTEASHPTYGGTFSMTGCNECHDVHSTTDNGYLLTVAHHDAATDMCTSCHTSAGNGAPGVGDGTHFTGDIASWTGAPGSLPWAATIDDDGVTGADWASATADLMVCETCHSVHKNGNAGYFLRIAQTNQNELCTTSCHDAN